MKQVIDKWVALAQQYSKQNNWDHAGHAYAKAADAAGALGQHDAAWRAWKAAGGCWRHADELSRALVALRRAYALLDTKRTEAAAIAIQMMSALAKLGQLERAQQVYEDIAELPLPDHLVAPLLNTRIELHLATGAGSKAAFLLQQLSKCQSPRARWYAVYRQGQLALFAGHFGAARKTLLGLLERTQVKDVPNDVAAVHTSLGELYYLSEDFYKATQHFELSSQQYQQLGRPSLRWIAEAGQMHAVADLGIQPLPSWADPGIALAKKQGLVPLEVILRIAKGIALAPMDPDESEHELFHSMDLSEASHLWVLAGRARLEWATRLESPADLRLAALQEAEHLAGCSMPLLTRIRLARAQALAESNPEDARILATKARKRFVTMGMAHSTARADLLLSTL